MQSITYLVGLEGTFGNPVDTKAPLSLKLVLKIALDYQNSDVDPKTGLLICDKPLLCNESKMSKNL